MIITGEVQDDELIAWYSKSHVFALFSHYEAFGLVYFEAMTHGLPVFTHDVGANRELLVKGAEVVARFDGGPPWKSWSSWSTTTATGPPWALRPKAMRWLSSRGLPWQRNTLLNIECQRRHSTWPEWSLIPFSQQVAGTGLRQIEEALLGLFDLHPDGLGNFQIADLLALRSDFRGCQKDYLTYSVLGGLLAREEVTWDRGDQKVRQSEYWFYPYRGGHRMDCRESSRVS